MAVNLINLRATSIVRCCLASNIKFTNNKQNFSNDAKKSRNLYATLGLPSSATQREIKKAYYDLTFKYHPDKNENCENAAIKFREVTEAYEILGSYALRKKYDKGIPITRVKKIAKTPVNHKAEFQEFFDSRSTPPSVSSDARTKEIHDLGTYSKKEETYREVSEPPSNRTIQLVTALFFIAVMYVFRNR